MSKQQVFLMMWYQGNLTRGCKLHGVNILNALDRIGTAEDRTTVSDHMVEDASVGIKNTPEVNTGERTNTEVTTEIAGAPLLFTEYKIGEASKRSPKKILKNRLRTIVMLPYSTRQLPVLLITCN